MEEMSTKVKKDAADTKRKANLKSAETELKRLAKAKKDYEKRTAQAFAAFGLLEDEGCLDYDAEEGCARMVKRIPKAQKELVKAGSKLDLGPMLHAAAHLLETGKAVAKEAQALMAMTSREIQQLKKESDGLDKQMTRLQDEIVKLKGL